MSFRRLPIKDAAVRLRPSTAVMVFDVLCIFLARLTISVVSANIILALPSSVIARVIIDDIIMAIPFIAFAMFIRIYRLTAAEGANMV